MVVMQAHKKEARKQQLVANILKWKGVSVIRAKRYIRIVYRGKTLEYMSLKCPSLNSLEKCVEMLEFAFVKTGHERV